MEKAALLRGKSYAITAHFMPNYRKSRHKVRRFLVFSLSQFIFHVKEISISVSGVMIFILTLCKEKQGVG